MTKESEDRLEEAKQKAFDHEQRQGQVLREEDYQALDEAYDLIRWLIATVEELREKLRFSQLAVKAIHNPEITSLKSQLAKVVKERDELREFKRRYGNR